MFELHPIRSAFDIRGFHTIYYFEFNKTFTHTPERHDFWEMVYVDNGSIVAITDGIGCTLTQGQAIFHEPNELHAHVSDEKVVNSMFIVTFTCDSPAMDAFRKKTFTLDKTAKTLLSLFIEEAKSAVSQFPCAYSAAGELDFSEADFGATQLLQCYFTEFLIHLFRCGDAIGKSLSRTTRTRAIAESSIVGMITDYMEQNLYEPLTLGDLCRHFTFGKSYICKIFRENTGKSPMDYYSELKLSEARRLLRNDELSVSEIAMKLNYSGIHNFSRAFKRATSFSPTAYKKSVQTQ